MLLRDLVGTWQSVDHHTSISSRSWTDPFFTSGSTRSRLFALSSRGELTPRPARLLASALRWWGFDPARCWHFPALHEYPSSAPDSDARTCQTSPDRLAAALAYAVTYPMAIVGIIGTSSQANLPLDPREAANSRQRIAVRSNRSNARFRHESEPRGVLGAIPGRRIAVTISRVATGRNHAATDHVIHLDDASP